MMTLDTILQVTEEDLKVGNPVEWALTNYLRKDKALREYNFGCIVRAAQGGIAIYKGGALARNTQLFDYGTHFHLWPNLYAYYFMKESLRAYCELEKPFPADVILRNGIGSVLKFEPE